MTVEGTKSEHDREWHLECTWQGLKVYMTEEGTWAVHDRERHLECTWKRKGLKECMTVEDSKCTWQRNGLGEYMIEKGLNVYMAVDGTWGVYDRGKDEVYMAGEAI